MAPTGATWIGALTVGVLFTAGTHLVLQRQLTRVVLGFGLLTHGTNVLLLLAGGYGGTPPFAGEDRIADPLPQAFALTAIVISLAVTGLLLALARRAVTLTGDDDVMDDVEDRRIADEGQGPA